MMKVAGGSVRLRTNVVWMNLSVSRTIIKHSTLAESSV